LLKFKYTPGVAVVRGGGRLLPAAG